MTHADLRRTRHHRSTLALLCVVLALAVVGCSDGDDNDDAASSVTTVEPASATTLGVPVTLFSDTETTGAPGSTPCGLRTPELPASALYCDSLDGIADGSVEVTADPQYCVAAATAPPELVAVDFWGKTDVVTELGAYFAALTPLAPPDLVERTQALADMAPPYLDLLQQRDDGEITAAEAEAEFQAIIAPVNEEHPDLISSFIKDTIEVCTPVG